MKALDKTRILAPSDYFYHFSFPRYGRLKSKFLCERYSHCIFSSCSIDLTKTRYTWSLTAVQDAVSGSYPSSWCCQCTMRFLLQRSVNRKICQNVYLALHFHFHFLICLVFPGIPLVKTTEIMIIISKVFFTMKGCTEKKAILDFSFANIFF